VIQLANHTQGTEKTESETPNAIKAKLNEVDKIKIATTAITSTSRTSEHANQHLAWY
jgi:hypothetical protein